jgi:tetratricopeptide (TPR) repeat protein
LALTTKEKRAALQRAFQIEPQNAETAYSMGEQLRLQAWLGEDDNQTLAEEALGWHQRAMGLNRWDPHARIRAGMCLDWLGRHEEAAPYFTQAVELDPNQWFVRGMMGWHYFQVENFAETQRWMERSLEINAAYNSLATTYLNLAKKSQASPGHAGSPSPSMTNPR